MQPGVLGEASSSAEFRMSSLSFMSFLLLLLLLACRVDAARIVCSSFPVDNRWCRGLNLPCPIDCPSKCRVDCQACRTFCAACNEPGAVCQDPRFIGGDGSMFYFHGKKDQDFCIVTDTDLHINAHFIGKPKVGPGIKRDFTWVQSLGILFGKHKFFIGAKRVSTWDESIDQLELQLDGRSISIPSGQSAIWEEPLSGLRIERIAPTNDVSIDFADIFNLKAQVTPVTKEDSRVHNYGITEDDCFAHLDISFQFHKLSPKVDGVLGKTYAPGYQSKLNSSLTMPVMGGARDYFATEIFQPNCLVARFGEAQDQLQDKVIFPTVPMKCGHDQGTGFACRRR